MIAPAPIISEAVQTRYDRALFEYRRASAEWHDAWTALLREQYARGEMADHRYASAETDA